MRFGKNAARLLLDRIEKEKEFPVQTKIIKTELVIKGSSMRKKKCDENSFPESGRKKRSKHEGCK